MTRNEKIALGGLLGLTLLTFALTFSFSWVYDDPPQIPGNGDLRWDRLGFLFTHHLWASVPGITQARFYRPLLALWFLINKTLFGLNPHWFHVTTVLVHLLATTLAFSIAHSLLKDAGGAFLAAAVFALHPLQVEPVSWISAVNDPLAAVFCFSSSLACRKARHSASRVGLWWTISALSFVFALLTKEVSAVLPAILLVDIWCDSPTPLAQTSTRRSSGIAIALFGVVGIAWLLVRRHILGEVAGIQSAAGWLTTVLTAPKILLFNLFRALLPLKLGPQYDFRPVDPHRFVSATLPLCTVTILAVAAFLAARKSRQPWVAYAWLLLPMLFSLNLRWLNEDDFIHDSYMYMSMLGVGLLVGSGWVALKRRWAEARLITALPAVLVVAMAFASAIQSQFWASDLFLFSRAVQVAPNNEWSHLNYGAALSARGKYSEAAAHFVESYNLKRGWRAANYAGFAFQNAGDAREAGHWYWVAVQENPQLADAWFALGHIQLAAQRPVDAIPLLQRAVALTPDAEGYHYALGSALEASGDSGGALDEYRIELRLHPGQIGARNAIDRIIANH